MEDMVGQPIKVGDQVIAHTEKHSMTIGTISNMNTHADGYVEIKIEGKVLMRKNTDLVKISWRK